MVRRPDVKPPKKKKEKYLTTPEHNVAGTITLAQHEKENNEIFDNLIKDEETFKTLKEVLSERGYVVLKESEMVTALASIRIVPGNEARNVVRNIIKKVIGKEVKEDAS